jgi:hypothetical protein
LDRTRRSHALAWERLISLRLLRFSPGRAFVIELPELQWRCFAESGFSGRGSNFFRECFVRSQRPVQVVREAIESRPERFPILVRLGAELDALAESLLQCSCLGMQELDFQRRCKLLSINGMSASVTSSFTGLLAKLPPSSVRVLRGTLGSRNRSSEDEPALPGLRKLSVIWTWRTTCAKLYGPASEPMGFSCSRHPQISRSLLLLLISREAH